MEHYGVATPPFYPTENIQGLPIVLVCGKGDKLCQPGDYLLLKEQLERQGSLVEFIETGFGHMSLLNPQYSENILDDPTRRGPNEPIFDHIDQIIETILTPIVNQDQRAVRGGALTSSADLGPSF